LLQDVQVGEFTVSATIKGRENGMLWTLTGVYGPQHDVDKQRFMLEMRTISTAVLPQWCILGDFSLIFRADQKSTGRVNRRLMDCFKSALDNLELKELKPHGRQFTWSSETANPTFTKIDHIFVTKDWELARPDAFVHALSTSASYHCPLLLMRLPVQHCRCFRFETYWTILPGFRDIVQATWDKPFQSDDKVRVLHVKLSRLAKALKNGVANI
jgi:hypothetical protein